MATILPPKARADFGIEIGFQPGSPDPSRIFRSMTQLIAAFEFLDQQFLYAVDSSIEPVLLLENVESGSLRTWLSSQLKLIDDSAMRDGSWNKVLGRYLADQKYLVIKWLEGKTSVISSADLTELEGQLLDSAVNTEVRQIPAYQPVSRRGLLEGIKEISDALRILEPDDSAKLLTSSGDVDFNLEIEISPETIDELTIEESLEHTEEMILRVKKPDFLGDSKWEFIHEASIEARITDLSWLLRFRDGQEELKPGDALRALVLVSVDYGFQHEVVSRKYQVVKVIGVIHQERPEQWQL